MKDRLTFLLKTMPLTASQESLENVEEVADAIYDLFESRRLKRNIKIAQMTGSAKGLSSFTPDMCQINLQAIKEGLEKIARSGDEFLKCDE